MFIFSKTTYAFLMRVQADIVEILTKEMRVQISGAAQQTLRMSHMAKMLKITFDVKICGLVRRVSLGLMVFERCTNNGTSIGSSSRVPLAYYDSSCAIVLNKSLIYLAKPTFLKNILRHELAHMVTSLYYKNIPLPDHGEEFKSVCRQYGWSDPSITSACADVEEENAALEGDLESERVLDRVKKLLALGSSDNVHEAELAMLRANQLLLKHNLDRLTFSGISGVSGVSGARRSVEFSEEKDCVYMARVLTAKRNSAKMQAISEILRTFLVYPVFSCRLKEVCLEVTGERANVQLAEYVANFLDRELDRMWEHARMEQGLSGAGAKCSFIRGVSRGYCERVEKNKIQDYTEVEQLALAKLNKDLNQKSSWVYDRLHTHRYAGVSDMDSLLAGKSAGRSLNIRPGVTDNECEKGGRKLLTH
ncbi:MAG: DUF2786 domain-containing protein [Oligoflexia bacterium]|nr:DUF2786 domain-containing protein [Oligoflexia bacterium]